MSPFRQRRSFRASAVHAAILATPILAVLGSARAADFTWDADSLTPAVQDGGGTWDTSSSNWYNGANVAWNNATVDTAFFGNNNPMPASTVSITGAVTVGGLTFRPASSYTLAGPGSINLTGPTVFTALAAGTINATLTGTGSLIKNGNFSIALGGSNSYSGGTTINFGATSQSGPGSLQILNPNALGTGSVNINIASVSFGTLRFNFGDNTLANAINLPAAAGRVDIINTNTKTATLAGKVSGGDAGLTLFVNLSSSDSSGGLVLANPNNDFRVSRIQLNRGRLGIAANGAFGNVNNEIFLDVTRAGTGNAGTGLHFLNPNINIPNPVQFADFTVINVNGNAGSQISGNISGTGGDQSSPETILGGTQSGGNSSGSLRLSGNNTFTHLLAVEADTKLIVASPSALGTDFSGSFFDQGTTVRTGATVAFDSVGGYALNEVLNINGDGVLASGAGVGAIENIAGSNTFAGPVILNANSSIGVTAGDLTLTGTLSERNGGARTLTKVGPGKLTIAAPVTYTGSTTVAAGTFALGSGATLPLTNLTVNAGATLDLSAQGIYTLPDGQLLQGNGTVTGNVNIAAVSKFAPGSLGTAGTITFASDLNLSGGTIKFDLGETTDVGSGTNDLIVANNLNLTGTTLVSFQQLGASIANGTYRLINYSGTLTGNASNLAIEGGLGNTRRTFTFDTAVAGQVNVTTSGANAANLVWTGVNGANWDLKTTFNFSNLGSSDQFWNLDKVLFDNTGAAVSNVNLVGTLVADGVTVDSSSDYTFGGSGTLAGGGGLTKSGTGALTINTLNTYGGVTTLNAGTLIVNSLANGGAASGIGAASNVPSNLVFNGGTLRYTGATVGTDRGATLNAAGGTIEITDSSATASLSGNLIGAGGLTKSGAGTLLLLSANTYAGPTVVKGGTLAVLNLANAGLPSGLGASSASPANLVLENAVFSFGGATGTTNRGLTLVGGGTLAFSNVNNPTVANAGTISGNIVGTGPLNTTGIGRVVLSAANTYTGGTRIYDGGIEVQNPRALGTGSVSINYTTAGFNERYALTFTTPTGSLIFSNDINLPAPGSKRYVNLRNTTNDAINRDVRLTGKITGGDDQLNIYLNQSDSSLGGGYVFLNPANDFRAQRITLNRGKLAIGANGAMGNPLNIIDLDVTRSGIENANTGLHFVAPNITLPNPIYFNDYTVVSVAGNEGIVLTGQIETKDGNNGDGNQGEPQTFLGGTLTAGNSSGSIKIAGNNLDGHDYIILANTRFIVGSTNALGATTQINPATGAALATPNATTVFPDATLAFDSIGNYSLAEQLIVEGVGIKRGGVGVGAIDNLAGSNSFPGPITIKSNTSLGASAGTLTLTGNLTETGGSRVLTKVGPGTITLTGSNAYTGGTIVNAGVLNVSAIDAIGTGTLTVNAGGTAALTPAFATAFKVPAINVDPAGKLDITTNSLVVDYTGSTVRPALEALAAIGSAGSTWTGNGITSSAAAASIDKTAVGIVEATDLFTGSSNTFRGQSIDDTAVLLRYTYAGDSDISGSIDSTDFNRLVAGFGQGQPTARWYTGDANYDGQVDTVDFNLLISNFGKPAFASALPSSAPLGVGSVVPEPASIGLLLTAATLTRRRRK